MFYHVEKCGTDQSVCWADFFFLAQILLIINSMLNFVKLWPDQLCETDQISLALMSADCPWPVDLLALCFRWSRVCVCVCTYYDVYIICRIFTQLLSSCDTAFSYSALPISFSPVCFKVKKTYFERSFFHFHFNFANLSLLTALLLLFLLWSRRVVWSCNPVSLDFCFFNCSFV